MNSLLNMSKCDITCSLYSRQVAPETPKLKPFQNFACWHKPNQCRLINVGARRALVSGQLASTSVETLHGQGNHVKKLCTGSRFVRTLLIDNYDSYTYNIFQDLCVVNGVPPVVIHNDEWDWEQIRYCLYEDMMFDNIVISPGPGSPSCPGDIGLCCRILLEFKTVPILGVCLGHQALGYVHGAHVIHAPEPVHGRLSEIEHNGCSLFQNIPSGYKSGFKAVRYHSLVIDAKTLPKELIPIAWTSVKNGFVDSLDSLTPRIFGAMTCSSNPFNENSNINLHKCTMENTILMGIMHSSIPHYGVQFHPESISTCYGRQIFKNFREITLDYWSNSLPSCGRGIHNRSSLQIFGSRELPAGFYKTWPRASIHSMVPMVKSSTLAKSHKCLKLFWKKLGSLVDKIGGPEKIFIELFGYQEGENTIWLDSSMPQEKSRFSYMGGKGGSLWQQIIFRLSDQSGGYLLIKDSHGSTRSISLKDGFLDFLSKELQSFDYEENDFEELPFDFICGYVGYLGYNLKVECGASANRHKSRMPDACFFFIDRLIVIDHKNGDVYLLSLESAQSENDSALSGRSSSGISWLDETENKLLAMGAFGHQKDQKQDSLPVDWTPFESFSVDKSGEEYISDVERCKKFIRDGESYELCLTTQFRKKVVTTDLFGMYMTLRAQNPAPYAAWLNFGTENMVICSSSPERFLKLNRRGILEAKPIKGTVARGSNQEEDKKCRNQLLHSEKDQAENLMIVDLLRNDLGRVCEPGTVHVPHLWEVETYASVHTMVSTVRGKKRSDIGPVDCVRAAFPGGSMTGAPKLRSMEILDSIEKSSRGVYSGSIGYFSYNQTFDLSIVIRTIVVYDGEASVGAGGAVIALSVPESEYEEMKLKAYTPAHVITKNQNHFLSSS